jgi:hypothetical protein
MLQAPSFRAEVERTGVIVRPQSGKALATLVERAAAVPKSVRERTAQLLEWKD